MSKQLELCILENDPSIIRNGKSRRELQEIILRYEELLAEKKKEKESNKTSIPATNLTRLSEDVTRIDKNPIKKTIKKKKTSRMMMKETINPRYLVYNIYNIYNIKKEN